MKTTPVFFKYMTLATMVEAVSLRKQLRLEEATALFREAFDSSGLTVTESYHTYYDTLDGHWGWWMRIEGQLVNVPSDQKTECNQRSEEHTSELQSPCNLVCRLLLEKKKNRRPRHIPIRSIQ